MGRADVQYSAKHPYHIWSRASKWSCHFGYIVKLTAHRLNLHNWQRHACVGYILYKFVLTHNEKVVVLNDIVFYINYIARRDAMFM